MADILQAARKGVRTRQRNVAAWKRYEEVDRPILDMIDTLINQHLACIRVNVQLVDRSDNGLRLKGGATRGQLLKVRFGGKSWTVRPFGYTRAHEYHASFWSLE